MADATQITAKDAPASATGAKNVDAAADATTTSGTTTEVKTLSTGEYLTAILLAVAPTTLGGALTVIGAKQNPTPADWTAALNRSHDSPAVNDALLKILTSPSYEPIITALRTPQPLLNADLSTVTYKDGSPVSVDYASGVRDLVWNNKDMLSTPWTQPPPHPQGADLVTLINLLSGFKQQGT